MDEVRAIEQAPLFHERPGLLAYRSVLVGRDTIISYDFIDGELARASYFVEGHSEVDEIKSYEDLVALLTVKHGAPGTSELEWSHRTEQVAIDTYGQVVKAIASGALELKSVWSDPETRIAVICTSGGSELRVVCCTFYFSLKHEDRPPAGRYRADLDLV
jgi:hypothetical protein